MKKIIIFTGFLLFFLLISSCATAFEINNIKIAGQPVPPGSYGAWYNALPIVSRSLFEKNPTISFDVDFGTPLGNNNNYYANILIGSDLYNDKNVRLGYETGNYKTSLSDKYKHFYAYYEPYVYSYLNKGDKYVDTIKLSPSITHYTYTLESPDILCFDAHRYEIQIYGSAYTKPYSYYPVVYDAKWAYASGDYSDDNYNGLWGNYELAQEFTATQTFDITNISLLMQRIGVLPGNYALTVSVVTKLSATPLASVTVPSATLNLMSTSKAWTEFTFTHSARLTKNTHYYIYVQTTNFGDATHKINWRKDTSVISPHYSGNWAFGRLFGTTDWATSDDTYMFSTKGNSVTPSYTADWSADWDWWDGISAREFVFNTLGNTVDRTGTYGVNGWDMGDVSEYVLYKQSNDTTSVFFGNAIPSHMKMQNSDRVGKGASFDTSALYCGQDATASICDPDVKIPITVILCDRNRKILDYAVTDSYMPILDTYLYEPLGPAMLSTMYINDFRLLQYTVGKNVLKDRQAYYMYVGVPLSIYNTSNTYITVDDTMKKTVWSTDKIAVGSIMAPDDTKSINFTGAYTYFETQISYVDTGTAGAFRTTPSWVTNFVIWCSNPPPEGLGLPWFAVIIGFLPAIACLGLVFYFTRKWEISLPSYIYGLSFLGGLTISWQIGLIALWIYLFFILTMAFLAMYNFREPISKAIGLIKRPEGSAMLDIQRERLSMEKLSEKRARLGEPYYKQPIPTVWRPSKKTMDGAKPIISRTTKNGNLTIHEQYLAKKEGGFNGILASNGHKPKQQKKKKKGRW